MKFSELTRLEKIGVVEIYSDADLSEPCYDSRLVTIGSAFFAIRGTAVDGHDFITSALKAGAAAIVLEDPTAFTEQQAKEHNVARILVRDARIALAEIAEEVFGFPSHQLRMIGVTGTNGKTTTASIIQQLMQAAGEPCGLIGTAGITIGDEQLIATHTTPESLDLSRLLHRMVNAGMTTCVMEVSSHALAMKRVAAIDFDIAVFTNFTQDHLDFHPSMEEYFKAKKLLFDSLKDTAVAITNADDPKGLDIVRDSVANSHTYGAAKPDHADLYAESVEFGNDKTTYHLRKRYSDEQAVVESPFIGGFNLENLLAAQSALYFGVEGFDLARLSMLTQKIHSVPGRLEKIALPNGASVFVDYAHTPDALEKALQILRGVVRKGGSLSVVFGCGGDRDKEKRPIMGRIAEQFADKVYITSDNPRSESPEDIIEQIVRNLSEASSLAVFADRQQAIQMAVRQTGPNDVLLIAGKGHETYQIIGSERHHFDDAEEVGRAIALLPSERAAVQ